MKLLISLLLVIASAAGADYHVIGKISIGGEGGWDYLTVDSEAHRLYVSHATHVAVVDIDAEKVIGDIPDTPGVHGIAVATKLNRGFVSNGRGNNVTIFDLKTLKTVGKVDTGQNPDAILYDPQTDAVFTFNGRSKDSTVIDGPSTKVKSSIPLGGKPEFAVTDGRGRLWVNIEDTNEIVELDTRKAAVVKRYSLTGCEEPSGLALDREHRRLFSVCANKVMAVSDPDAGKVVATVPIGANTDGAAFDATRGLAFSSNGDSTMTVVGGKDGKYQVVANVPTERGARTIALDPRTHKLYLPSAQFGPTPAATADQPRPRPTIVPGTFVVLVVGE